MLSTEKILFTKLIFFSLLCSAENMMAQKGNSMSEAWEQAIDNKKFYNYDSTHPKNNFVWDYVTIFFGKWYLMSPKTVITSMTVKPLIVQKKHNAIQVLFASTKTWNDVDYTVNSTFEGRSPDKYKLKGKYTFSEHFSDAYKDRGLFFLETGQDYVLRCYTKSMRGQAYVTDSDTADFQVSVDFDRMNNAMNDTSYLHFKDKLIRIQPLFHDSTGCCDPVFSRRTFDGFDFMDGEKKLAGITLYRKGKYDFWYKFWMNDELDIGLCRSIATVLGLIVTRF